MQLSKCCNLPLGAITRTCPGCNTPHDIHGNPYPTPPISTVEGILNDFAEEVYLYTLGAGDINDIDSNKQYIEATQAINRLIQQAELRGRIDEVESARNAVNKGGVGYFNDWSEQHLAELQAQLKGGKDEKN